MADKMIIPFPPEVTSKIAYRAVQLARAHGTEKRWNSTGGILPVWGNGYAGIRIAQKYSYLKYVDRGTKPFLMTALEGKTVFFDGSFHKVQGVGQPGWVTLPGGVKVFRDQKWRHPGIKPQNFIRGSIQQAVREHREELIKSMMSVKNSPRR